ncbi:DNA (cytosine-5)-methyltransferase 1 [Nocardioides zeae]|uniref:DNA (Cytosine-5)-methyltransferase 1 n=1 Tax=Nocardioides zeae TaxID=1457234 RepID=A0ACC6IEQ9_9ACTN|nr:DNA cytosine methyltransferase [Nocardioides zeae]MDR6174293.1 DNA (cytosine-5)-methyltransferase 1 [Nocardioides zeae]MDR6209098.1 DNA (cytosine-5)-methyltransferase 1 [Nocardioides zeae]
MATSPLIGQRTAALALSAHPEAFAEEELQEWAAKQIAGGRPIAIDLFSGAGGLSAGIEASGWSVAAAVDLDRRALETHRHNFPGLSLQLDLGDPEVRDEFVGRFENVTVDLVAGGPPCQPFSRAGRSKIRSLVEAGTRDEVDLRKELWRAFLDVALRLKPRAVLMENVPDMGLGDDFAVVRIMVDELESQGYVTQVKLADAWHYGVPQHRKRLILLARNDGQDFDWPEKQPEITTLWEGIGDLPDLDGGRGDRDLTYHQPDEPGPFLARMRDGAPEGVIHDHMTRGVRPDDLEIFKLMDSRTLYSEIPVHLRRYAADSFTDKYKRLGWKELSRSITAHIAKDGYWYIHPDQHRTLTVREAARVQTFPDRFRFAGTRSDAFRQIGNAVPPMLGEAASSALLSQGAAVTGTEDRPRWLDARHALATWGQNQAQSTYWFALPGPGMTAPAALAAATMSSGRFPLDEVGTAVSYFRGLAYFNSEPIYGALEAVPSAKRALARLLPLMRKRAIWRGPDEPAEIVRLNASERRIYDMLRGSDVLLRSQGVLRLAARVAGTSSHETNRLTEGRMDVARLVGSGSEAPTRMAAIRLLAATTCLPNRRDCGACPLATWCLTHRAELALAAGSQDEVVDPVGDCAEVPLDLALPHADHLPAERGELGRCATVTVGVGG